MRARSISHGVPTVPLWVLALAVTAHTALKGLYFSAPFKLGVAFPIEWATRWTLTGVTLAGAISWVVLVTLVMGVAGKLRLSHLGLSVRGLGDAVPVLLAVWLVVQAVNAALSSVAPAVTDPPPTETTVAVGRGLQAVFGSGLIEEVFYRGFLMTQAYAHLRGWVGRERALVAAVALSSLYFGVSHIPAGLAMGLSAPMVSGYVLECALVGSLFAGLYLRTGNLYIAAGAHAVLNEPAPLVSSAVDPALVTLVVLCLAVIAWPALAGRFSGPLTVGHLDGRPAL